MWPNWTEASATTGITALRTALDILLRLFAPFIPFATEEVWSWTHADSVHTASWPVAPVTAAPSGMLATVGLALIGIRRAKTDAKASQKTEVVSATIGAAPAQLEALERAAADLRAVGRINELRFVALPDAAATDITVSEVVLAESPAATTEPTAPTAPTAQEA